MRGKLLFLPGEVSLLGERQGILTLVKVCSDMHLSSEKSAEAIVPFLREGLNRGCFPK